MNSPVEAQLATAPFSLDADALRWVRDQKAALQGRRRLAQLFNVMLKPGSVAELAALQPGGITQFTLGGLELGVANARSLAAQMDLPLLVSADLEGGSFAFDGSTPMPGQLGMAALPAAETYDAALTVMAREARAIGINWSFTPVLDINANFRNPVVGTRSFGSDPVRVQAMGIQHIRRLQAEGLATTAKHWPGEGFDARDQHLLTTINPLSVEEWQRRFGAIYRDAIAAGVKTIMTGHIAFPAYARACGDSGLECYRPGSISRRLNLDLLRGELGFNGLICSDATEMAGLSSWSRREDHLPEVIESGCDMILFTSDLAGDLQILEAALADGRLSAQRVDDALTRVLGLKASLGLHLQPKEPPAIAPRELLRRPEYLQCADRVASDCITLVKDVQHTLPLSVQKHRRITLVTNTDRTSIGPFQLPVLQIGTLLQERGFDVRPYSQDDPPNARNTDLLLYVLTQESMLTVANIFFDWLRLQGPMGHAMRRSWHELPCVLVSMGHPYYLNEAPRMPCVINAYSAVETVQRAVVRKLLGEENFIGGHPVDAFCGHEDARY